MNDDALHPVLATQRQRSLILRVIRFVFFIISVTVALVTLFNEAGPPGTETGISLEVPWWLPVIIAVGLFGVALFIDLSTPNKKISTISGVFLGLFAGLLATVALSLLLDLVLGAWLPANIVVQFKAFTGLIKLLLGISLCYLGIVTVLQTQDEFRLVIPYVEFSKQVRGVKPLLLDTSALIDGRIVDIAATGLLQSTIVIPRFVIGELQALADSQEKLKRSRGRRGLDSVGKLQRTGRVDVMIEDPAGLPTVVPGSALGAGSSGGLSVDQALVELAQQLSARIVTTDSGLARVAQIQGLIVLNMHDLALAMRPSLIPGERLTLAIIKPGEQAGQGVSYLDDGTMVVVEHASGRVGQEVQAVVVSTMQTTGGRLVFARAVDPASTSPETQDRNSTGAYQPLGAAVSETGSNDDAAAREQLAQAMEIDSGQAAKDAQQPSASLAGDSGGSGAGGGAGGGGQRDLGTRPSPHRREPTGRNPRR